MSEDNGKLSIGDFNGKVFVIPFYQRGYRWTQNEAKRLFLDLLEFAKNNEVEYCLQPIVLQSGLQKEEGWDNFPPDSKEIMRVVDGQQRLTTIAILLNELGIQKEWDIYYITEKRTLSEYLNRTGNGSMNKRIEEGGASFNTDENLPINDFFRNEVRTAFSRCILDLDCKEKDILRDLMDGEKKLIDGRTKTISFLRYDILSNTDGEGQEVFLRLNDGKTPLTSSELIRALYMVNASGLPLQEQMEISKEWEIIENTLCDEQFWLMFNSKGLSDTPTRIDLLFALVKKISLEATKANPRIVFEEMDNPKNDLQKIWHNVLKCFWWMQSCYDNIEVFNYLCWIREFTDVSARTIYDNWRNYPKPEDFKKSIIAIIQNKFNEKEIEAFNYDCDKDELRALFVLLNVLECNHNKERFRFDLYNEIKRTGWDIEHIDSQTPNELKDIKCQRKWIESSFTELSDTNRERFKNKFSFISFDLKIINNKQCILNMDDTILSSYFQSMAEEIVDLLRNDCKDESLSDDNKNAIGNLALLNASINRSYKNTIFPLKRNEIKNKIVSGDCYVPPCTAKAFMKFYTESPSKITYWLKTDFDAYFNQMKDYYKAFMDQSSDLESREDSNSQEYKKEKEDKKELTLQIASKDQISEDMNLTQENHDYQSFLMRFPASSPISYIKFMQKYHIVIPKIQRLYVQGRLDSNGKKCLSAFAKHLVATVTNKEECLLDFIYGIDKYMGDNNYVFYPLDGQQRLTTLLLLAWLCGENTTEWAFRYESRRATECFIKELLRHAPPDIKKPDGYDQILKEFKVKSDKDYLPLCSDAIKKTDWFLSAWETDPGIAGMLEMLDSLYCKILNADSQQFDIGKIYFYVNYLNTSTDSYDQIFLKMNSRGKPLTAWENVKAVLDQYVPSALPKKEWQEKMNNTWQESLWRKLGNKTGTDMINKLDTKMLSVVELALTCVGYEESAKDNTFRLAEWMEKKTNKKDKAILEFYNTCSVFYSALDIDLYKEALTPAWSNDPIKPDFTSDSSEEYYKPLLAYFAATRSIDKDWMRVVWNIVENADIQRSTFPSAYRLIKELSLHANDILIFLAEKDTKIVSPFAKDQVSEERLKARQIINPPRDSRWNSIGPACYRIQYAETCAFFKGAIRFLFTNDKGETDWLDFDKKFENAIRYFGNNGVSDKYRENAALLRRLLTHFNCWEQWRQLKYDFTKNNWRGILINKQLTNAVHKLLIQDDVLGFPFESYKPEYLNEEKQRFSAEYLVQKQVLKDLPEGWKLVLRQWWDAGKGVYDLDPNTRGSHPYLVIHPRLFYLSDEEITPYGCEDKMKKDKAMDGFIPGVDIFFKYRGYQFKWVLQRSNEECEIYLCDGNGNYVTYPDSKENDSEKRYCGTNVGWNYNIDFSDHEREVFKNKLNDLINISTN